MGQQNGKDASRGGGAGGQQGNRRIPVNNVRTGAGGMRTQTVNDALVAPRQSHPGGDGGVANAEGDDTRSPQRVGTGESPVAQQPRSPVPSAPQQPLPVVLRYKNTDAKQLSERKVDIDILLQDEAVPQTAWRRMRMSRSDDNYFVIVDLKPGEHRFRFSIADRTQVDPTQPTVQDNSAAGATEPANVVQVNADVMHTKDDDDLVDDGAGWGQLETQFEETRKYPPMLPPHLRYTPLNTPPTQIRCQHDGSLVAASTLEAEHLPFPLSVTINHVYFQKRDDHVVSGMTTRYCNKFATIAYYRSIRPTVDEHSGTTSSAPVAIVAQ